MNEVGNIKVNKIPGPEDFEEGKMIKEFEFRGETSNVYLLHAVDNMQTAIRRAGFSKDSEQALFLFISEVTTNALKARGSRVITDKYGSFEKLVTDENHPRRLVDEIIADNYKHTILRLTWHLDNDKLVVKIKNNTELNPYLEDRVKNALSKDPEITEDLLDALASEKTLYDSNASGIGMGLSMASKYSSLVNGKITYRKEEPGWTTFELVLYKNSTNQVLSH